MLPPLVSALDVSDRFDGDAGENAVRAAIEDASALVRDTAGLTWVDDDGELEDLPDIVVTITANCAVRALTNPTGIESESVGPFSVSHSTSAGSGVYLTKKDESRLKALTGGSDGFWTQQLTGGDIETPGVWC